MQSSSRANGARFYVYLYPAVDEVWTPYIEDSVRRAGISADEYDRFALEKKMLDIAARRHIGFVPQIAEFMQRSAEGPFHLLPRDPHCNEVCYRITADILAQRIVTDLSGQGPGPQNGDGARTP